MDLESFLKKKKKKKHPKKGVSPSPTPSPGHKHKKSPTSAGEAVGEHLMRVRCTTPEGTRIEPFLAVGHHGKDASPSRTLGQKDSTLANALGQCPAYLVGAGHAPFAVISSCRANSAAGPPLLLVRWASYPAPVESKSQMCRLCV